MKDHSTIPTLERPVSNSTTESRSNFGGFVILVGIFTILIFTMKVVWVLIKMFGRIIRWAFQKFQARPSRKKNWMNR